MNYQVLVKKNKDEFILYIEELSIVHKSKNLDDGYKKINQKLEQKLEELKKFGITNNKTDQINYIKPFFFKTIIISLALIFIISFSGIQIMSKVNDVTMNLKNELNLDVKNKIKEKINNFENKDEIDQERKSRNLELIKKIVKEFKPYYKELEKIAD
jgi:hypothetical protein